jgi:hypothetical protein
LLFALRMNIARQPSQSAGYHQVNHKPQVSLETYRNAFADAAEGHRLAAFGLPERRLDTSEEERLGDPDVSKRLVAGALCQSLDIQVYVG